MASVKTAVETMSSTQKRQLSTSSNESPSRTTVPKRQRQKSVLSEKPVVEYIDEDDFDENFSSAEETSGTEDPKPNSPSKRGAAAPAKAPVTVNWAEMLEAMTEAFNDVSSPFTIGLSKVIDMSDKLNNAHERLDQIETKLSVTDQTIHEMCGEI